MKPEGTTSTKVDARLALPRAPDPYRVSASPVAAEAHHRDDGLVGAQWLARRLLVGWAFARVAVCAVKGLDIEGFVALVIVVTAMQSLARSLA